MSSLYFSSLEYVKGDGEENPESVAYTFRDGTGGGVVIADSLMIAPWRSMFTALRPPELNDSHIDELILFIRHNRDAIKFSNKPRDYDEWRALGIPLEDYVPVYAELDQKWLNGFTFFNILGWEDRYGQEVQQWVNPYLPPSDRPRLTETLYHTFARTDDIWKYCGLCQRDSTTNEVSELYFYGKLDFPGPGGLGGPSLYYHSAYELENDLRHWKAYNRPVERVYLTRQEYIRELEEGKGLEIHRRPHGPLTAVEIAKEAELVISSLHMCYNRNAASYLGMKDTYEVLVSNRFMERAETTGVKHAIELLLEEFPHKNIQYRIVPNNGFRSHTCRLYFPFDETEAREGVGLEENEKRFRNADGTLAMRTADVNRLTDEEAKSYYRHGEEYIIEGMRYTCYRYVDHTREPLDMCVFSDGISMNIYGADPLGTFLPDVASDGNAYVAVKDKRFQPLPCLTKSLRAYVEKQLKEDN